MDHQTRTSAEFSTTTPIRRRRLSALSVAGFAVAAVLVAPGVADAADGCTTNSPRTIATQSYLGRTIELRANSSYVCAWGRIFGGIGDRIWTDRADSLQAANEGRWSGPLGLRTIDSGGSNFSDPYNDEGKVMRACGSISNRPNEAFCTIWW